MADSGDWQDDIDEVATSPSVAAQSLASEMVKITGLKYEKGDWSWNADNVVNYFKEQPVWATFDAITLAAPIAKWGIAAREVAVGGSAAGQAYKAGTMGFREAVAMRGAQQFPRTQVGRFLANPIETAITPEYRTLMAEHGATKAEKLALADVAHQEFAAEQGLWRDEAAAAGAAVRGLNLNDSRKKEFVRFLEAGITPEDIPGAIVKGEDYTQAYNKVWKFREKLGRKAEELNLLDPERRIQQKNWMPLIHEDQYAKALKKNKFTFGASLDDASWEAFSKRKYSMEEFEKMGIRDFDPAHAMLRMSQAAQVVAREQYMVNLTASAAVKDTATLTEVLLDKTGPLSNGNMRAIWGVSEEARASVMSRMDEVVKTRAAGKKVPDEEMASIFREVGWVRLNDVAPGLKLPPKYKDLFVDGAIAHDVVGAVQMMRGPQFPEWYQSAMNIFKLGKTAWNPATHVRNGFGAYVFHSLATNLAYSTKAASTFYQRGREVLAAGPGHALFDKMARAGVTSMTFDPAEREALHSLMGSGVKHPLAWFGDSKLAKYAQKGADKMERFYRYTDEVSRADAWIWNYEKFAKQNAEKWAGKELDERSIAFATNRAAKYIPSFNMHSPMSNMVRQAIPFSTFSHEAVRVWKNTMIEKPHMAMFWSHFADSMSEVTGAMSGYTEEQVDAAKKNLPYYQQGKKMLLMPFKIFGVPQFLDMSYLIPLANIVEIERDEGQFMSKALGFAGLNPTANPFVSIITAAVTGQDPFKGQPLEPKITERQLGINVDSPQARELVGLAEHALTTFVPPLVPPGYAGMNMVELIRQQRNPKTGALEEPDWKQTLAANLAGIRLHRADANAAMKNVGNDERRMMDRTSLWWERWSWAMANNDASLADDAEENLHHLAVQMGKTPDEADKYVADGVETRQPGLYKNYTKKRVGEALDLIKQTPQGTDPENTAHINAMTARTRNSRRRQRSARTRKRSR